MAAAIEDRYEEFDVVALDEYRRRTLARFGNDDLPDLAVRVSRKPLVKLVKLGVTSSDGWCHRPVSPIRHDVGARMAIGFGVMVQQLTHLGFEERRSVLLDATKLSQFRTLRGVYLLVAVLLIGLGVAGISIPGFPGTIFLIVALWFAGRSNERLYRWMLTNRLFGRQLVDYESGFGIPRRIKFLIVSVIAGFTIFALVSVDTAWVLVLDVALAVYGIWYVWTRPTREDVVAGLAASA